MSVFKLSTKDRIVAVEKHKKGFVSVVVETMGNDGTIATAYYLESTHYDKLTSYQSLSALVKYAKANQKASDYPKTNSNSTLRVETSCPRPPETSFDSTVNANARANDVDGGIFKCLQCNKFTNGYELDANNGYCNTCYAEPEPLSEFHKEYVCAKYVDGHCILWESRK